ncbi:MAG TPA: NfeD family protein [Solirubrobacterales bacterium]|nr:NfeD family protein [Solirubrobacterales bacterium]
MEVVIVISAIAAALLLAELLLPTGGVLAVIGAAGLIAAGLVAFGEDGDASDFAGAGLITLGVLSVATFFLITPKILRAHRDEPIRTGWEELLGDEAEVRETLDPEGAVWIEGALWRARVADDAPRVELGTRVLVESVDGLTLVVRPVEAETAQKGT